MVTELRYKTVIIICLIGVLCGLWMFVDANASECYKLSDTTICLVQYPDRTPNGMPTGYEQNGIIYLHKVGPNRIWYENKWRISSEQYNELKTNYNISAY